MGSKVSSERKSENKIKEKQIVEGKGASQLDVKDSNESYKGIKSELSSASEDNISKSNAMVKTKEIEEDYERLSHKIKINLEWKDGGKTVYVTGSFSNWKQWFLMNKSATDENEFYITLDLPKGVYQFKFIVDSAWRCSKEYIQQNDGYGNINNVIDTTVFQSYVTEEENTPETPDDINKNTIKDYGESIPKKSDLNLDAPFVPYNYIKSFSIETQSKQNHIGLEEYFNYINIYLACENNSYRKIASPPHVNLNLIFTNINSNKRENIINISSTFRTRNKYCTFIYYKPKN